MACSEWVRTLPTVQTISSQRARGRTPRQRNTKKVFTLHSSKTNLEAARPLQVNIRVPLTRLLLRSRPH